MSDESDLAPHIIALMAKGHAYEQAEHAAELAERDETITALRAEIEYLRRGETK